MIVMIEYKENTKFDILPGYSLASKKSSDIFISYVTRYDGHSEKKRSPFRKLMVGRWSF